MNIYNKPSLELKNKRARDTVEQFDIPLPFMSQHDSL